MLVPWLQTWLCLIPVQEVNGLEKRQFWAVAINLRRQNSSNPSQCTQWPKQKTQSRDIKNGRLSSRSGIGIWRGTRRIQRVEVFTRWNCYNLLEVKDWCTESKLTRGISTCGILKGINISTKCAGCPSAKLAEISSSDITISQHRGLHGRSLWLIQKCLEQLVFLGKMGKTCECREGTNGHHGVRCTTRA